MPATVINASAGINSYRSKIAQSIEQLREKLTKTEGAIATVNESWKDPNFQQFQQNFETEKEMVRNLCNVLTDYQENVLYQLEQKLRDYEGTRMSIGG